MVVLDMLGLDDWLQLWVTFVVFSFFCGKILALFETFCKIFIIFLWKFSGTTFTLFFEGGGVKSIVFELFLS